MSHGRTSASRTTAPWLSRIVVIRCGVMIVPPLATAPATMAICIGVADTSLCPIDAWASFGGLVTTSVGKLDRAGAGMSMGTVWLKPKASEPRIMSSAPMVSWPICAKAELHDTRRISGRAPPQAWPPKFEMGRLVCGGV